MGELDHWQPALLSRELGRDPVGVTLCGHELVLFRDEAGLAGALEDRCPHRGMRLSLGRVRQGQLECPYHGWCFARDGHGHSPGTPRLKARASAFEVVERYGAVWIKPQGVDAPFPRMGGGAAPLSPQRHRVEAPLELVLDNFTEVEHTGAVHLFLGYDQARLAEVVTRVEVTDDEVYVYNEGPQRPLPAPLTRLFGIHPGDLFVDEWTTRFSPVHTLYQQWWYDPASGQRRPERLHIGVVFVPDGPQVTSLFVFPFTTRPPAERFLGLGRLLVPLMDQLVTREVLLDKHLVERLADKSVDLRGKKLSRFDRPMGEHRRRLASIYRHQPPEVEPPSDGAPAPEDAPAEPGAPRG